MSTRVVIADDSPAYLEFLVAALDAVPELEVVGTASDGLAAVAVAVERGADAMLLDVEMPRLDGFGAAEVIRCVRPRIQLFLHTGGTVAEHRHRAEQLGVGVHDKLQLWQTIELLAAAGARDAA